MTFSVSALRASAAGSGLATYTSEPPTASTLSRPSITSSAVSQDAVDSTRSPAVKPCAATAFWQAANTSLDGAAGQGGTRTLLGDDLVAVYPHRGRVVGDPDRQIGHRAAERVQRQHRHLAGAGRVGLLEPLGGAQRDVGIRGRAEHDVRADPPRRRTAPPRSASAPAAARPPGYRRRRPARRAAGCRSWRPSWPA